MTQNRGLLVDVDIESSSGPDSILTLAGGGGESEVNSNIATNKNIFDNIETVQSYQSTLDSDASTSRQRERINSVDSTQSIRSYDSTGNTQQNNPF